MAATIDLIGVGNALVDSLANVDDDFIAKEVEGEKGGMMLVNTEELAELKAKVHGPLAEAPGGSAANTVVSATGLGTKTAYIGMLGNDEGGEFYRKSFAEMGTDMSRAKTGTVPNGRCLSLVTPDSERTMRTDLGAAMTLAPEDISVDDFKGCRLAHIEGYLLFNPDLMKQVVKCAKEAGCEISLDLASFEVVNAAGADLLKMLEDNIDIVFANEDEAKAVYPAEGEDYERMARLLAGHCKIAAVKLGKDGALIASGEELVRVEADVVKAVDTTGAGDYWAGGFLHGYLQGKSLAECGRLGSKMGAAIVQVMGAALPDQHWQKIRAEVA
ncbi:MAG: adenosine kinase [Opitutales bacterium]